MRLEKNSSKREPSVRRELNGRRISADDRAAEDMSTRQCRARGIRQDHQSSSEAKQKSNQRPGRPSGPARETCVPRFVDRESGGSARSVGEHHAGERMQGRHASDRQIPRLPARGRAARLTQLGLSPRATLAEIMMIFVLTAPTYSALGARNSDVPMGVEPVADFGTKPTDWLPAELPLLRKSPDE